MLFQHLYNWIKYKMLPPSMLFKNRLFIERDSKFRRITNNLGLTFRNSKWTNLEMKNLHFKFFTSYFIIIATVLTFLFIIFTYLNISYYSNSTIFNQVAFVFWSGLDLLDYYISFFIWSFIVFITTFFKGIYSYFYAPFTNSDKQLVKLIYLNKFKDEKFFSIEEEDKIAKKDYKWVIFTWLNSSNNQHKDRLLETLFATPNSNSPINDLGLFFRNLFKMTFLIDKLALGGDKFSQSSLANNFQSNDAFLLFSFSTHPSLGFFKNFSKFAYFKSYNLKSNTFYAQKNINWNLISSANIQETPFSLPALFYPSANNVFSLLTSTNFKETYILNLNLFNKTELTKTYRWFYKYSLIHRRNFKNTHKITLTKKLLSTGVLNKHLTTKNLWNSEFYTKFSKVNLPHSFNSLFQTSQILNSSKTTNLNSYIRNNYNTNKLINLEYYENSYFWVINRFKTYNHLQNNQIFSLPVKALTSFKYYESQFSNNILLIFSQNPANGNFFISPTKIFDKMTLLNARQPRKDVSLILENDIVFEHFSLFYSLYVLQNIFIAPRFHNQILFFNSLLPETNRYIDYNFIAPTSPIQHDIGFISSLTHMKDMYTLLNIL